MSADPKDPKDTPKTTPPLADDAWRQWYIELHVALDDIKAVTEDLLRRKRKRDLGIREAKRLHHDAQAKLAKLLAYADRGGSSPAD